MTTLRSCSVSFLVLMCGLAMASCKHKDVARMSMLQPEEQGPIDPPLAPALKRVTVGTVMEPGGTLPGTSDQYMHFQTASDYVTPPKCKPEGFRAVCGPYDGSSPTSVDVVTYPKTFNNLNFDQCPEIDGGYATLWGWRPYIRLQRVSAAAEGSWIIVQPRSGGVERIMLVNAETNARVFVWDNTTPTAPPRVVTMNSGTFVDVSPGTSNTLEITTPLLINADPQAAALLAHASARMK